MGRSGVDVWRIQAVARHSSSAILWYLDKAHHGHLVSVAVEAQLQQSIQEVRQELRQLQYAAHNKPPEASAPPPPAASSSHAVSPATRAPRYVECARAEGHVHSCGPERRASPSAIGHGVRVVLPQSVTPRGEPDPGHCGAWTASVESIRTANPPTRHAALARLDVLACRRRALQVGQGRPARELRLGRAGR